MDKKFLISLAPSMSCMFIFAGLFCFCCLAHSKEPCYQGYDSSKCWAKQAVLQKKIRLLYAVEEKQLAEYLKNYEPTLIQEAVKSVRNTNLTREKFKDAECYSEQLKGGMSLKDSGVIADACKVEWREQLVNTLTKKFGEVGTVVPTP